MSYEIISKYNKRLKRTEQYYNIACSFDIETTSVYVGGEKFAYMYLWGFMLGNYYYTGRTWEEFTALLTEISKVLGLSEEVRLICYIHNFSYEFQFMRKYFDWVNIFATDERKPLKGLTTLGIEFRCSYMLSGMSLAKVAENLTSHEIEKLTEIMDYNKIRTPETILTDEEKAYMYNDVLIVKYYIDEQLAIYDNNITKIPLTNTGRVREYVKNRCFYSEGKSKYKSSKGRFRNYKRMMNGMIISTAHEYELLKLAFQGGFTHANAYYTGEIVENVTSLDFCSSYPAVMLSERFPMSKGFTPTEKELTENGIEYYLKNFCCLMVISFKDIKNVFIEDCYISSSKCQISGKRQLNNGRVYSAEYLTICITEVDYKIIEDTYAWTNDQVHEIICYPKAFLPKAIIESILDLYEKKTTLKGVAGKEVEYLLYKGMLNSIYGMAVTDILHNDIIYNGSWRTDEIDPEKGIADYNKNYMRFLYYPWGVWVTAYARRNLWQGIQVMGHDYLYSDTDSIKALNYDHHKDFIDYYNKGILLKIEEVLKFYKLDVTRMYPKTIKGQIKPPGVWENEGTYSRFKTLGAKRYMYEQEGELHSIIAGLARKEGMEYLKEVYGDNTSILKHFDTNLQVPAEKTGKLTHTYIDTPMTAEITDYQGHTMTITSLSYIHLEGAAFTLTLADQYIDFYNMLKKGFINRKGFTNDF